jgi:hypothetical protein
MAQAYEKQFDMRHLGTDQTQFHTGLTDSSDGEEDGCEKEGGQEEGKEESDVEEQKVEEALADQPAGGQDMLGNNRGDGAEQKEDFEADEQEDNDEHKVAAVDKSIVGKAVATDDALIDNDEEESVSSPGLPKCK